MDITKEDLKKNKRLIFYKLSNEEVQFLNELSVMTFIKFGQLKKMYMGLLVYFYLYKSLDQSKFELPFPFFGKLTFDMDQLKEKINYPFQLQNDEIEIDVKLKLSASLKDVVKSHLEKKSVWLEDLFLTTIKRNLEDKLL